MLNEYRAVFAGLFARLYGLDAARLAQVFPGVRPLDLKLVDPREPASPAGTQALISTTPTGHCARRRHALF